MSKTIYIALISVGLAAVLSFLFFHYNFYRDGTTVAHSTNGWTVVAWAIYGTIYVFFQLLVGAFLKPRWPLLGKGLMLGAGLIFLIGFGVCSSGLLN